MSGMGVFFGPHELMLYVRWTGMHEAGLWVVRCRTTVASQDMFKIGGRGSSLTMPWETCETALHEKAKCMSNDICVGVGPCWPGRIYTTTETGAATDVCL